MIGPIVTDADRRWALSTLPPWIDRRGDVDGFELEVEDDGEWLDCPRPHKDWERPSGPMFVAEQAEAFERFFVGQYKTYADWSSLWRKSWWPKADPAKRFPKMAPKTPYPFFRAGTKEFSKALELGTPDECRLWKRFKVAHFAPNDPRVKQIQAAKTLTKASRRMTGDEP